MVLNLKQYRDPELTIDEDVIGFYPREFYPLDNFSSFQVEWRGKLYPTSEHAYQAAHFFETDPALAEQVRLARSAHDAQKIARENSHMYRKDWDEIKPEIMKEILLAKVEQQPYVKHKLLETGDYEIVEDSPKDDFWGWGADRKGRNQLGKIWMEIRDELRRSL